MFSNLVWINIRRWIVPLFLVIIIVGCGKEKKQVVAKKDPTIVVRLGDVRQERIENRLEQVGSLKATQDTVIRAEIAGQITEIAFEEGKPIRKGELLVQLKDDKFRAQMKNDEALIQQLQIRLANRQKEKERNTPLLDKKLVSAQQFDNLQSEIKELEAQINQARASMALNNEKLKDASIHAPIDGTTGARTISIGDYIEIGDTVATIVLLNPLEIEFKVPEKNIPAISIGENVDLTVDAYPGTPFVGTVFFIAPDVDLKTRMAVVKARIPNEKGLLKPGMFARVSLILEVHENAILVPTFSILRMETDYYLYYLQDKKPKKQVVKIGKRTEEWTEITNPGPLKPGMKVVTEGKYATTEDAPIRIIDATKTVETK